MQITSNTQWQTVSMMNFVSSNPDLKDHRCVCRDFSLLLFFKSICNLEESGNIKIKFNWVIWTEWNKDVANVLINHNRHRQPGEPVTNHNSKKLHIADVKRGKMCMSESWLVKILLLIGQKIGTSCLSQSCSVVSAKPITYISTLKWKPS